MPRLSVPPACIKEQIARSPDAQRGKPGDRNPDKHVVLVHRRPPPVHRATQLVCTTHTLICVNSLPLHRDRMISRPIAVPGGQDAREWTAPAQASPDPPPEPSFRVTRSLRLKCTVNPLRWMPCRFSQAKSPDRVKRTGVVPTSRRFQCALWLSRF